MNSKWSWAVDAAGKLDELEQQREQLRDAIGTHTDGRRILQQWATLTIGLADYNWINYINQTNQEKPFRE